MYDVSRESPYAFLSEEEIRAWYAYMKVQLRLRYEMTRQLRVEHDLSLADYDVLVALLSDDRGVMSVSDVAVRIGAERSRVSHQVRRMAGRGLVTLRSSADDRRATEVVLSDVGREALGAATPSHVALVRSVFLDALSDTQTRQLAEALEQVYENLIAHGTLPRPADHP